MSRQELPCATLRCAFGHVRRLWRAWRSLSAHFHSALLIYGLMLTDGYCRTPLQSGVVDVALRATDIKSLGIRIIQRLASFDARWQVGVRNKLHAERNRIGRPFADRLLPMCES